MEGYTLSRRVRELLSESSGGSFMNARTTYDCIYDAVKDFNKKTHYLTATESITIVPGTSAYNLPPSFVTMAIHSNWNEPMVKWTVSGTDSFVGPADYQDVILSNNSATATTPESFSVIDAGQIARITGTTTASGASSSGETTLTDANADFTDVAAGDFVHNLTDGSHGIVISKTSSTVLICALFEGTNNDWTSGDSYVIVPQARFQIIFSPTPSASATATIVFVAQPSPVYSPYMAYKLPSDAELPISQFAAFLYKYKDREANYGDALFQHYERFMRKAALEYRRGKTQRSSFSVNLSKRNKRSTGSGYST